MKNLINNLLETSKDRLKNPLIGAFIFSWIAINWEPVSVLFFSTDSIYVRIDIIEECYTSLWLNFFLPLLIAVFYIVALPYVMLLMDKIPNWAIKRRKEKVYNMLLFELKWKERLATKELEIQLVKANHKDFVELNNQINGLKKTISEKEKNIDELNTKLETHNNKEESISAKEKRINHAQKLSDDNLIELEKLLIKLNAKGLEKSYVEAVIDINKGQTFNVRDKNTDYYIQLGLIKAKSKNAHGIKYDLTDDGELVFRSLRFDY